MASLAQLQSEHGYFRKAEVTRPSKKMVTTSNMQANLKGQKRELEKLGICISTVILNLSATC